MTPLLELLYKASDASAESDLASPGASQAPPGTLHLLSAIFLILSQEEVFVRRLHSMV